MFCTENVVLDSTVTFRGNRYIESSSKVYCVFSVLSLLRCCVSLFIL